MAVIPSDFTTVKISDDLYISTRTDFAEELTLLKKTNERIAGKITPEILKIIKDNNLISAVSNLQISGADSIGLHGSKSALTSKDVEINNHKQNFDYKSFSDDSFFKFHFDENMNIDITYSNPKGLKYTINALFEVSRITYLKQFQIYKVRQVSSPVFKDFDIHLSLSSQNIRSNGKFFSSQIATPDSVLSNKITIIEDAMNVALQLHICKIVNLNLKMIENLYKRIPLDEIIYFRCLNSGLIQEFYDKRQFVWNWNCFSMEKGVIKESESPFFIWNSSYDEKLDKNNLEFFLEGAVRLAIVAKTVNLAASIIGIDNSPFMNAK